jgi:hypothetical protein
MEGKLLKLDELLPDPDFFLVDVTLVPERLAWFTRMTQKAYRDLGFHEGVDGPEVFRYAVELDLLNKAVKNLAPEPRPIHYIFTPGFCCSTLVSRAVGELQGAHSLREPRALTRIGELWNQIQGTGKDALVWNVLKQIVLYFLARTYRPQDTTVIKPADTQLSFNRELLSWHSDSKAIYLYPDLRSYLISVLKRPPRRENTHERLSKISGELGWVAELGFDPLSLNDARTTALVWLIDTLSYVGLYQELGPARIAAVCSDDFLDMPADCLAKMDRHLGFRNDDAAIRKIAGSDLFSLDAKKQRHGFDAAARRREEAQAGREFADEIRDAMDWIRPILGRQSLPAVLPGDMIARTHEWTQ